MTRALSRPISKPTTGAPPRPPARPAAKTSVFAAHCPAQQALERIADKWTALVIYRLEKGPKRSSELQREIGGISSKMLTQTLRGLERDGLVRREVFPVIPPRVEYSLTPLGRTLTEPLKAICRWAEANMPKVQTARAAYDATNNTTK